MSTRRPPPTRVFTPPARRSSESAPAPRIQTDQGTVPPQPPVNDGRLGESFQLYIDYRGTFFPANQLAGIVDALDAVTSAVLQQRLVILELRTGGSIVGTLAAWAAAAAGAVLGAPVVAIVGSLAGAWLAGAQATESMAAARSRRQLLPFEQRDLETRAMLQEEQALLTRVERQLREAGLSAEEMLALGHVVTLDPYARDAVAKAREAITASNIRALRLGSFELKAPD